MSSNSLLISNKKSNQTWLKSMRINHKIGLGYAVALGISVSGTILGVTVGNYWEQHALEHEETALADTAALHRLQTGILQVRTHQQQLIPLSKQPEDFEEEYNHIIKHSHSIQKEWSEIKAIKSRYYFYTEVETSKLENI